MKLKFQTAALIFLTAILSAPPAAASKIQQQGIVTTTDCSNRGISNSSCLPKTSQLYDDVNGQLLNSTLTALSGGTGYAWNDVTSSTQTLVKGNAYLADNSSGVSFTLPSSCSVGDSFIITGKNSGGWSIFSNSSASAQTIHMAGSSSQSSSSNSIKLATNINQYDSFYLTCSAANSDFIVTSGIGGILQNFGIHSEWLMNGSSSSSNELDSYTASGYTLAVQSTVPTSSGPNTLLNYSRGPYGGSNGDFKWAASGSSSTVFDSQTFGVMAWVKYTGDGRDQILAEKWDSSTDHYGWQIDMYRASTGNITVYYGTGSSYNLIDTGISSNDGSWHHIAIFNIGSGSNQFRLYKDGSLAYSTTGFTYTPTTLDFYVGIDPSGSGFNGQISQLIFVNSPSSSTSAIDSLVSTAYNSGNGHIF